jgi:hypothetical protein
MVLKSMTLNYSADNKLRTYAFVGNRSVVVFMVVNTREMIYEIPT